MIKIYNMDVMKALKQMPDESVDCVVTSPPYWGLRDYGKEVETIWDEKEGCEHEWGADSPPKRSRWGDVSTMEGTKQASHRGSLDMVKALEHSSGNFCQKCGAWKGQLGLEPTFQLYIYHLCNIFDEVKRVLKKSGTCFVNLGDTYNSHSANSKEVGGFEGKQMRNNLKYASAKITTKKEGVPDKCLCCIPDRFKLEMINRDWTCRNEIIWYKRNCMPSSVRDRFTVDFEKIFFFVKDRKYYFEKILVPIADTSKADNRRDKGTVVNKSGKTSKDNQHAMKGTCINSVGRNMRCVWDITTKGFKDAHFAVFPEELPKRCIKAGCPEFVCNKCGKPREKIIETKSEPTRPAKDVKANEHDPEGKWIGKGLRNRTMPTEIKQNGWKECSCNAGFSHGVVLDLFCGSGTSLKVARDLNRNSIGIEINPNYIEIIKKRLFNGNSPVLTDFEIIETKHLNT